MIRLELPFPPPLSACFNDFTYFDKVRKIWTSRRVPSKRYDEWKDEAHRMINKALRGTDRNAVQMPGEVRVIVRLVAPDRRERDADNSGKALMDILSSAKIIENDSNRYVRRLTFAWEDEGRECVIIIKPFIKGADT